MASLASHPDMIQTKEFGELEVFDSHIHFFSSRFFRTLVTLSGYDGEEPLDRAASLTGWDLPPDDPTELGRAWHSELATHGVDGALLIGSVPGDQESVSAAVVNEKGIYAGAFMIDAGKDGAGYVAERAFSDLGMKVVCLFPAMFDFNLSCEGVRNILSVAASIPGTAAFIHCGALSVGARKKLGVPSRFNMSHSNPLDVHTLAKDFSSLPFIVPHFGSGMLREALMLADLCSNVYLDTSSSNKWMGYYAPALNLVEVYRAAIRICGADRLLFGTDSSFFPRGWVRKVFQEQVEALAECSISEAEAQNIFSRNIKSLLHIT